MYTAVSRRVRFTVEGSNNSEGSYVGAFRAEMPRRGKVPTLRWGKHSVRLYAGRTRRKAPAPPAPKGRKEFNAEKENSDHHRKNRNHNLIFLKYFFH